VEYIRKFNLLAIFFIYVNNVHVVSGYTGYNIHLQQCYTIGTFVPPYAWGVIYRQTKVTLKA